MVTNWNPTIEPSEAAVRLWRWGYFADGEPGQETEARRQTDWTGADLTKALVMFQGQYEQELIHRAARINQVFELNGKIDPFTEALLLKPRCGLPDVRHARSAYGPLAANWPTACRDQLTFSPTFQTLGNLTGDQTLAAFREACASWTEALQLALTLEPELGQKASIWADSGRLTGGVLAWSYLATNSCAVHLQQRYGTSAAGQPWTQRFLQGVSAHELGHALGLEHDRDPSALMYPYARPEVYLPAGPDLEQAVRLGYAKRTGPVPPPEPPPGPTPGGLALQIINNNGTAVLVPVEDIARIVFTAVGGDGAGGTNWNP